MKYIFIFTLLLSGRAFAQEEPNNKTAAGSNDEIRCVGGGDGCPKDSKEINWNQMGPQEIEKRWQEYDRPGLIHPDKLKKQDGTATKDEPIGA